MSVHDARQQVEIAVSVFAKNPTDVEALDSLVKAGLAEGDAAAVLQLVPMAFGRVLLLEMGVTSFEDEFHVKDDKGDWVPFRLSDQPAYCEGMKLALAAFYHGALPREAFAAVATRSAEVGAASKALDAGSTIKGGTLGAAAVWGVPMSAFVPRKK
jgi:hypothetical protein